MTEAELPTREGDMLIWPDSRRLRIEPLGYVPQFDVARLVGSLVAALARVEELAAEVARLTAEAPQPTMPESPRVRFECPTDEQQCEYPRCIDPGLAGGDYYDQRCFDRRQAALNAAAAEPQGEREVAADFANSFDAREWARAFVAHVKANPAISTDEGTMIGWFANAIMRGWDARDSRFPPRATADAGTTGLRADVQRLRQTEAENARLRDQLSRLREERLWAPLGLSGGETGKDLAAKLEDRTVGMESLTAEYRRVQAQRDALVDHNRNLNEELTRQLEEYARLDLEASELRLALARVKAAASLAIGERERLRQDNGALAVQVAALEERLAKFRTALA